MNLEFRKGISETLDILEHMSNSEYKKISKKFLDFLNKNQSMNYNPSLDYSKKLSKMNLKDETKNILAIIYLQFLCTPEEKMDYMKILSKNNNT